MSLKKSALKAILWTFIQQMGTQGINLLVSIILARILLPSEFGLIALLTIFMGLGNTIIYSGLTQSLIRTENPDDSDFSTIFFFNIIISLIVYIFIFFLAPIIADFYKQPLLTDITRVYCTIFIIGAFSIIQNTRLIKEMDFKTQTIINLPSIIIASIVGITMALNGYGVWSLVWSAITKSIALNIQLWWWSPWKPSFNFNKSKIKHHLNYGYKITLSGIINTLFENIYTIIIGKFYDPIQVGFFNRADTLKQLPVQNFSAILNTVTFPLFSKIQNDDAKLKSVYKKIMQLSIFLIAPTLLFMAALAEPLFRFVLTEKWLPAVPYFQILCFSGILHPISVYNLTILNIKGRSDLFLKIEIIKKIIVALIILISFQWGIYGLLYGNVLISVIGLFINSYYTGKIILYNAFEQLKDLLPAILLAVFSSGVVLLFDQFIATFQYSDIFRILFGSVLGISIFGFFSIIFKFDSYLEIKSIINSRFNDSKRIEDNT
jgi:teichuronic acid exporter